MEDLYANTESKVNFVPCIKWVKKGVAKENPEKVQLNKEELVEIINQTRSKLQIAEDEEDEDNEAGTSTQVNQEEGMETQDEFNLDKYDDEEEDVTGTALGIASIAELPTEADENFSESDDSEKEDDIIKPGDNLLLAGRVDGDASILEVYVYNEDEGSLYVHHDLLLPSFPLCLEWLDYEPGEPKGSYVAVGTMNPIIEIWDLDVVNCLEPAYTLGRAGSKKKNITRVGHKDAVLDLAWNSNFHHILASGSVDKTIVLWDLDKREPSVTIKSFTDKVQCLQWHSLESQTLLAGGCDKTARVFDCRTPESHLTWLLPGEAERVTWNESDPFVFLAGTSTGTIECIDCRKGNLWSVKAHEKEVTGLSVSPTIPGLVCSTSPDGSLKVWDCQPGETPPRLIYEKDYKMGVVHCLEFCPDSPFVIASGGDNKSNNLSVLDLIIYDPVKHQFGSRDPITRPVKDGN